MVRGFAQSSLLQTDPEAVKGQGRPFGSAQDGEPFDPAQSSLLQTDPEAVKGQGRPSTAAQGVEREPKREPVERRKSNREPIERRRRRVVPHGGIG